MAEVYLKQFLIDFDSHSHSLDISWHSLQPQVPAGSQDLSRSQAGGGSARLHAKLMRSLIWELRCFAIGRCWKVHWCVLSITKHSEVICDPMSGESSGCCLQSYSSLLLSMSLKGCMDDKNQWCDSHWSSITCQQAFRGHVSLDCHCPFVAVFFWLIF